MIWKCSCDKQCGSGNTVQSSWTWILILQFNTNTCVKYFPTQPLFCFTGQGMFPSSHLFYSWKACHTLPRAPTAFTILLIFVLHFLHFSAMLCINPLCFFLDLSTLRYHFIDPHFLLITLEKHGGCKLPCFFWFSNQGLLVGDSGFEKGKYADWTKGGKIKLSWWKFEKGYICLELFHNLRHQKHEATHESLERCLWQEKGLSEWHQITERK